MRTDGGMERGVEGRWEKWGVAGKQKVIYKTWVVHKQSEVHVNMDGSTLTIFIA